MQKDDRWVALIGDGWWPLSVNSKELHGLQITDSEYGNPGTAVLLAAQFPSLPLARNWGALSDTSTTNHALAQQTKLDQTLLIVRNKLSRRIMQILQVHSQPSSHPAAAGKGAGLRDVAASRGFRRR